MLYATLAFSSVAARLLVVALSFLAFVYVYDEGGFQCFVVLCSLQVTDIFTEIDAATAFASLAW